MENPTLLNLSPAECKVVSGEVLKNSGRLWQTTEVLGNAGDFGMAISTAVVSTEELIKALILTLDGSGFEFRNAQGVSRFFTDHKIRHFTSFLLLALYVFGNDFLSFLNGSIHNPTKLIGLSQLIKSDKDGFEKKIETYFKRKFKSLREELDWFAGLEKYRQNGFYYDYNNNPLAIGESAYLTTIEKLACVRKAGHGLIVNFKKIAPENLEDFRGMLKNLKEENIYGHLSAAIMKTGKNKVDPFDALRNLLANLLE